MSDVHAGKILGFVAVLGCGHSTNVQQLRVTSDAFAENGAIPKAHTCQGADTSPALAWTGTPLAKSYVVIVDDPDAPDPKAPKQTWVHWIVIDLPPATTSLPAGTTLPPGAAVGTNDFGKAAWGGPCPPIGRHRYFFKVYALDTTLGKPGLTKPQLLDAMADHVVARGELIGTYQKEP